MIDDEFEATPQQIARETRIGASKAQTRGSLNLEWQSPKEVMIYTMDGTDYCDTPSVSVLSDRRALGSVGNEIRYGAEAMDATARRAQRGLTPIRIGIQPPRSVRAALHLGVGPVVLGPNATKKSAHISLRPGLKHSI